MADNDKQERTIYICNIDDENIDEKLLEELFIQVGPIESITIKDQRPADAKSTGKPRFAFVEFSDVESVLFACKVMDGIKMCEKYIKVQPRDNTMQKEIYKRYLREKHERNAPTKIEAVQPPQPMPLASYSQNSQQQASSAAPIQVPLNGGMYGNQPIPINNNAPEHPQNSMRDSWQLQQQQQPHQAVTSSSNFFGSVPPIPAPPVWYQNHLETQGISNGMFGGAPAVQPSPLPKFFEQAVYRHRKAQNQGRNDGGGGRYFPNQHSKESTSTAKYNGQPHQQMRKFNSEGHLPPNNGNNYHHQRGVRQQQHNKPYQRNQGPYGGGGGNRFN